MLNSNLETNWSSFGKHIRIVAIFSILIMIPYFSFIAVLIQFIFICLAIGDIKGINRELKDPYINSFSSTYLATSLIKFIGLIIINIAGVLIAKAYFFGTSSEPYYLLTLFYWLSRPAILILILGFAFMIFGCAFEISAWKNLNSYFYNNTDKFPTNIYIKVSEGTDNLSSAAFLWALGFLIVPIIIGWIFYIAGYFKLTAFTKDIKKISVKVTPTTVKVQIPELKSAEDLKYCPNCGSKIEDKEARYCGFCGFPLYDR